MWSINLWISTVLVFAITTGIRGNGYGPPSGCICRDYGSGFSVTGSNSGCSRGNNNNCNTNYAFNYNAGGYGTYFYNACNCPTSAYSRNRVSNTNGGYGGGPSGVYTYYNFASCYSFGYDQYGKARGNYADDAVACCLYCCGSQTTTTKDYGKGSGKDKGDSSSEENGKGSGKDKGDSSSKDNGKGSGKGNY